MSGPDVTVTRVHVYSPGYCVLPSPPQLPAEYGLKCKSPDRPPRWVQKLLSNCRLLECQENQGTMANTSATRGHAHSAGGGSTATGELQTAAPSGERDTDVQEDESHQEGTSNSHAGSGQRDCYMYCCYQR